MPADKGQWPGQRLARQRPQPLPQPPGSGFAADEKSTSEPCLVRNGTGYRHRLGGLVIGPLFVFFPLVLIVCPGVSFAVPLRIMAIRLIERQEEEWGRLLGTWSSR